MYSCRQYKYRRNEILIFVFYRDDIGRGVIKNTLSRNMLCGYGLELFGSRKYGHGLDLFVSRNGVDADWSLLAQGMV